MYRLSMFFMLLLGGSLIISNCSKKTIQSKADAAYVAEQLAKFAPVTIQYDCTLLDSSETKALKKIVAAAQYMDKIFSHQVYSKNCEIKRALIASPDSADQPYLDLFSIMFGPFNRLEEDKPFICSLLRKN